MSIIKIYPRLEYFTTPSYTYNTANWDEVLMLEIKI